MLTLQGEAERSKLRFRFDAEQKNCIAVVIDYSSDGVVVINQEMLRTGRSATRYLYITTKYDGIMSGTPEVRFIHQQ